MQTTLVIRAHQTVNGRGREYKNARLTLGAEVLRAIGLGIGDRVEIRIHRRRIEVRPAPETAPSMHQVHTRARIAAAPEPMAAPDAGVAAHTRTTHEQLLNEILAATQDPGRMGWYMLLIAFVPAVCVRMALDQFRAQLAGGAVRDRPEIFMRIACEIA